MLIETFAASVNGKSCDLISEWKDEAGTSKRLRREVRALKGLKVEVRGNFIDRGTALVTQDFCVNQTVSLLLM